MKKMTIEMTELELAVISAISARIPGKRSDPNSVRGVMSRFSRDNSGWEQACALLNFGNLAPLEDVDVSKLREALEPTLFRKGDVVRSKERPNLLNLITCDFLEETFYWELACRREDLPDGKSGDRILTFGPYGNPEKVGVVAWTRQDLKFVVARFGEKDYRAVDHGTYYVLPKE